MAEIESGSPPIVVTFTTTEAEDRSYIRAAWKRQTLAIGSDVGWYAYLGAIPVGLLGGFAAIGLGVEGESGATVAMLIGLGYILGQRALYLVSRLTEMRLVRAQRLDDSPLSITIDESGVTSQWHKSSTVWSWEDITELTREHDLLFFWIGHTRGMFVPRRALAGNDEAQILRIAKARISPKPAKSSAPRSQSS
jgi:hypothetical protein